MIPLVSVFLHILLFASTVSLLLFWLGNSFQSFEIKFRLRLPIMSSPPLHSSFLSRHLFAQNILVYFLSPKPSLKCQRERVENDTLFSSLGTYLLEEKQKTKSKNKNKKRGVHFKMVTYAIKKKGQQLKRPGKNEEYHKPDCQENVSQEMIRERKTE